MKRIYRKYDQQVIAEENGMFGIEDKNGHLLFPFEYDRITSVNGISDSIGFLLCKNGKFGYVELGNCERLEEYENGVILGDPNGCALAFLPCIYDWIDAKRNGLAIYSSLEKDVQDLWYDYKSRTLYRQMRYQENLGDFDVLIDFSHGACIPEIKKAGADEWVRFPKACGIDVLGEIPTDIYGVTFALCAEWITDPDDESSDDFLEYSFLLLYKNGWTVTRAVRTLAELYAQIPAITQGHAHKKDEATNEKQSYRLLCKYKKRNEEWD